MIPAPTGLPRSKVRVCHSPAPPAAGSPPEQLLEFVESAQFSVQHCWHLGELASDRGRTYECVRGSMNPVVSFFARSQGQRRPDLEWPAGTAAWVAIEHEANGPKLEVDGEDPGGSRKMIEQLYLKRASNLENY